VKEIRLDPVQLFVASIASIEECNQIVALLQEQRISVVVKSIHSEKGSSYELTVQPLFAERARGLVQTHFGTGSAQLIHEDGTILWAVVLFFFIFPVLLVLFPYEREPMNLAILFVLAILPGIFVGQKKSYFRCEICRAKNDCDAHYCSVCKRKFEKKGETRKSLS